MLNEILLCCPTLNFTQDKTAKAEEEVSLLEEQSQDYKDRLDKAHREIEKLKANSQPVGYIFTVFFLVLMDPLECLEVAFTGAVRIRQIWGQKPSAFGVITFPCGE